MSSARDFLDDDHSPSSHAPLSMWTGISFPQFATPMAFDPRLVPNYTALPSSAYGMSDAEFDDMMSGGITSSMASAAGSHHMPSLPLPILMTQPVPDSGAMAMSGARLSSAAAPKTAPPRSLPPVSMIRPQHEPLGTSPSRQTMHTHTGPAHPTAAATATTAAAAAAAAAGGSVPVLTGREPHGVPELDADGVAVNTPQLKWFDNPRMELLGVPVGTATEVKLAVTVDKGFMWIRGHGFTCPKKNHFQITADVLTDGPLTHVAVAGDENPREVTGMYLDVHGVRSEDPKSTLQLLQATLSRQRNPLEKQVVHYDQKTRRASCTVPRLHFAMATENNVRKKGRVNPLQRYFQLVVRLVARTTDGADIPIAVLQSEPFIVRATSPKLLQSSDPLWAPCEHASSAIYTRRQVGINFDETEQALTIGGDCRLTGEIYRPSDSRVKQSVTALDPSEDMAAVRRLELHHYTLRPEWAETVGRRDSADETGVIAQQLATVLPDAVKLCEGSRRTLGDGSVLHDLLLVKKERLGTALIAAVQAVAIRGDALRHRLEDAERESVRLQAEIDSIRAA
eukprot:m.36082 g.36082  ORF g.36082 m.36082 type:complete len:567 (-) comp5360_c0_seq1:28-1728(-)